VGGFLHGKIQNFQQTSPAAPVVNAAAPFQFGSLINLGTATINSATLTFTGTSSPRDYTAVGTGDFSILDTFSTQGQLDSAYQNGNFTVSINTTAGTFSRTIFLFPFSYPTTPQLLVPAGDWQGGALVLDPTVDYTFTWNAFANAQAPDVIELVIRDSGVALDPFPATQTSFTLPAGSLQPNTVYTCDLAFVRVAGASTGDTDVGPGFATLVKDTGFTISSIGLTPTPSPTATATPIATPTPVTTPTPTPVPTPTPTPTPAVTPTPTATPTPAATPTPTPSATPAVTPGSFGNISTRLRVETGDNVLIGGFIISGTQPKKVIIRAIGPSLTLAGALTDPFLELRDSSGVLIRSNDNWRSDQETEIIATTIPPSNDLESAIVETLPANNSAYTAIVRGVNDGTGIGVVEVYDLNQAVDSKLANISTRGLVQTEDNVLIGGLIVLGQNPLRVIVRAIGPSLSVSGALGDPTLELHNGNGATIASNDNWRSDQEAEIIATTIPPSNDLESAIVRDLAPGNYTAIVRGVDGTTGVALVEAYGLN
jgi:cell division septation protein DedD